MKVAPDSNKKMKQKIITHEIKKVLRKKIFIFTTKRLNLYFIGQSNDYRLN